MCHCLDRDKISLSYTNSRVRRQHEFGGAPDCYEACLSKKISKEVFEELGQGGDDVGG